MSGTRTHVIWKAMRQRCQNPRHRAWQWYGARGIKVCDRWQNFELFLADMGEAPPGMSIERRNNNGHYDPTNCHWTTRGEQSRNRRSNRIITYRNRGQTLMAWAEETGLKRETIALRLERGWTTGQALGFATPPTGKGRAPERANVAHPPNLLTYKGKTLSISDWAREVGLPRDTIRYRVDRGWTAGQALGFEAAPDTQRGAGPSIFVEHKGRKLCLRDWAEERGIAVPTLRMRLGKYGWTVAQALGFEPR
jgi:hypothetical protein